MASKSKNFFTVYDYIHMNCAGDEFPELMNTYSSNLKKSIEDEEKRKQTIKINKETKEKEAKNRTFKYISSAIKTCISPATTNQIKLLLEKMNDIYNFAENKEDFTLFIDFIRKGMSGVDAEKYSDYFNYATFLNSVLKGVSKQSSPLNDFVKSFYDVIFKLWPKKNFTQKGVNPEPHLKDVEVDIEGSVFETMWKK